MSCQAANSGRDRTRIALCAGILCCALDSVCVAQSNPAYSLTSTTDRYGNAQPTYLERRSAGLYQNPTQRRLLESYQAYGRRQDRRGYLPFSLGGRRRGTDVGLLSFFRAPRFTGTGATSGLRRDAFNAYGGFGQRHPRWEPGSIVGALERKKSLIAATSVNAPVLRAFLELQGRMTPSARVAPADRPAPLVNETDRSTPTLAQRLERGGNAAHDRALQHAWDLFGQESYRAAARTFDTATLLSPANIESRLGEMICHLSIGATRTALAVFRQMLRRDPIPFLPDIEFALRFSSVREALRVRLETRLLADTTDNTDIRAMYTLVLWSMGQRREALIAADRLEGHANAARYAAWAKVIRAVGSTTRVQPSNPGP